jgi:hypothetical protein
VKAFATQEKRRQKRRFVELDTVLTLHLTTSVGKKYKLKALVQDETAHGLGLVMRHHLFLQPLTKIQVSRPKMKTRSAHIVWVQGCDTVIARVGIQFLD